MNRADGETTTGLPTFNAFIDARRLESPRWVKDQLLFAVPEPPHPPDPADRIELWRVLATLSPRERAVLVPRYYEDLKEAEIADVLGI